MKKSILFIFLLIPSYLFSQEKWVRPNTTNPEWYRMKIDSAFIIPFRTDTGLHTKSNDPQIALINGQLKYWYVNRWYSAGTGSGSYTLPIASNSVLGGVKIGNGFIINGSGVLSDSITTQYLNDKVRYKDSTNIFIGIDAGGQNLTGNYNLFLGAYPGVYNTTGSYNIFEGFSSGYNNITGNRNIFIGGEAGGTNTTGSDNIYIGNSAGSQSNLSNRIGIGTYNSSDTNQILIYGNDNLHRLTVNGTFVSNNGFKGTDAISDSAFVTLGNLKSQGASGLTARFTGSNIYFGQDAFTGASGIYNNVIGGLSGYGLSGDYNNIFGYYAGVGAILTETNAIGEEAGESSLGFRNNFYGVKSGYANIGNNNIGIGGETLNTNSGDSCIAIGYMAGYNNTKSKRIFIGEGNDSLKNLIFGNQISKQLFINGQLLTQSIKFPDGSTQSTAVSGVTPIDGILHWDGAKYIPFINRAAVNGKAYFYRNGDYPYWVPDSANLLTLNSKFVLGNTHTDFDDNALEVYGGGGYGILSKTEGSHVSINGYNTSTGTAITAIATSGIGLSTSSSSGLPLKSVSGTNLYISQFYKNSTLKASIDSAGTGIFNYLTLQKIAHISSPKAIITYDSISHAVGFIPANNSKNISIDTISTNILTVQGVLMINGNISVVQLSGSLTDGAPTNAQIVAIIGKTAAVAGAGYQVTIKDTDGTGLLYKVESDGTNWFYVVMTKAL